MMTVIAFHFQLLEMNGLPRFVCSITFPIAAFALEEETMFTFMSLKMDRQQEFCGEL